MGAPDVGEVSQLLLEETKRHVQPHRQVQLLARDELANGDGDAATRHSLFPRPHSSQDATGQSCRRWNQRV